jgi:hypothetical protein
MGKFRVQQSIIWVDGFESRNAPTSGGKGFGGGKNGLQLLYSADVIAALCDGGSGILGIGDVWSGQSWLRNNVTNESYVITGTIPKYTPTNAAFMTGDHGVAYLVPLSTSYNDLGAPSATVLATDLIVPFQQVPYVSGAALAQGTYSVDTSNNYYFSTADNGTTVIVSYTYSLKTITKQLKALIPSGLSVSIPGNLPFTADDGVIYYSTGTIGAIANGTALRRVSGTPTVTGTYSVDSGSYYSTLSGTTITVTVVREAKYTFAPGDVDTEVMMTYNLDNSSALPAGTPSSLAFTLLEGTPGQAPWALLESNYPSASLGYPGIALVCYSPMDMGYSGQLQQNLFEVLTADAWGGGIPDCNPVQCVLQVLSNPVWGLGRGKIPFPVSAIDNGQFGTWGSGNAGHSGNNAQAYIRPVAGPAHVITDNTATAWFAANNFFISPVIDRQDTAASLIGKWLEAGMCAAFMSEGLMKLAPYGDTSAGANGATWTAPTVFAAELDDSDFIAPKGGKTPVKISEPKAWQDAFNTVQVSWSNRGNQYSPEVTPESDQAAINRYGERIEDPQTWDFITTLPAATFAAVMRVKRNVYIRNQYQFTLSFRQSHLEPMDIISLTTTSAWAPVSANTLQLWNQPARIIKTVDNPDGTIDVTAEDFIFGVQQPTINNKGVSGPAAPVSQYADPSTTDVVVFNATQRLSGFYQNQLWMGAFGLSEDWGGCNVHASQDGVKYQQIGTIENAARLGVLAAAFSGGTTDPDTADTMIVNLPTGSAALESGTTADADSGTTLCALCSSTGSGTGLEIISYSSCAMTGLDQYTAGTYIRRGLMGTTSIFHELGSQFLRLDDAVFKYTYDPSWTGKTIYLKFQSFNRFGNSAQDLSTVAPLTITVPATVAYGAADPTTGVVTFTRGTFTGGIK